MSKHIIIALSFILINTETSFADPCVQAKTDAQIACTAPSMNSQDATAASMENAVGPAQLNNINASTQQVAALSSSVSTTAQNNANACSSKIDICTQMCKAVSAVNYDYCDKSLRNNELATLQTSADVAAMSQGQAEASAPTTGSIQTAAVAYRGCDGVAYAWLGDALNTGDCVPTPILKTAPGENVLPRR